MGPPQVPDDLDAIVIGAGFGGVHMMWNLRGHGFKVKAFEQNETFSGLWYWPQYPAPADWYPHRDFGENTIYDDDMWKDWTWARRFPDRSDCSHRQYFGNVDSLAHLAVDIYFNSKVIHADWDKDDKKWVIQTENGLTARAPYLMACNNTFNKRYISGIKGIEKFCGPIYHTAEWPKGGVNLKGKRVAVIGTGASGLQCIRDIHASVRHLTVYHGMPSFDLPTNLRTQQSEPSSKKRRKEKGVEERIDKSKFETFAGFSASYVRRATFSDDASMRLAFFESLWRLGGFYFWLTNYIDLLFDRQPNDPVYKFWCDKAREHMEDPMLAKKPLPCEPPKNWGTKRPSPLSELPEIFERKDVDLIDVCENPVIEVTPNGIETRDTFTELDVVVLATGYDVVREGLSTIDMFGDDKDDNFQEEWARGILTYHGPMMYGYPNLFVLYHPHPHEPSRFCSGPKAAEIIGNWVANFLQHLQQKKTKKKTRVISARREAAEEPKEPDLENIGRGLLIDKEHPYMGPDQNRRPQRRPEEGQEGLNFSGLLVDYMNDLYEEAEDEYPMFSKKN